MTHDTDDSETLIADVVYDASGEQGATSSGAAYSGGVEPILKELRSRGHNHVTRKQIKQWLEKQFALQINKPARKRFPTTPVFTQYPFQQMNLDLADFPRVTGHNNRNRYVLVAIGIFSRRGYVDAVGAHKSSANTAKAFERILSRIGRNPETVRTDMGTEFLGAPFAGLLKQRGIQHRLAEGAHKANYAERFIRTIRSRLQRYMLRQKSLRYLDFLPRLEESYNETKHRSIGMTPNEVTRSTVGTVLKKLHLDSLHRMETLRPRIDRKIPQQKQQLKVGDLVRLSRLKGAFGKEADASWSFEIYRIKKVLGNSYPLRYIVEDLAGEPVTSSFYSQEMQRVSQEDIDKKVVSTARYKTKTKARPKPVYETTFRGHDPKWTRELSKTELNRYRQPQ